VRAVAVIDDLLNAFMGLDGKYARARRVNQPDGAHIKYTLEARADPSLQELATRMLKQATLYQISGPRTYYSWSNGGLWVSCGQQLLVMIVIHSLPTCKINV
jgi:hypothetical protein